MLKRQSKLLSIALIFVFCMSFMFAGFAAPQAAQAATTYDGSIQPYLQQGTTNVNMGQLVIKWDLLPPTAGNHVGIITLPSGLEFNAPGIAGTPVGLPVMISSTPAWAGGITYTWLSNKEVKLELAPAAVYSEVTASVVLPPVDVASDATLGEAYVDISHLSGLFAPGRAHVANISGGQVLVSVVDTATFNDGVASTVELTIKEDSKLGLDDVAGTLKLKLPKGYTFDLAAPAGAKVLDVATNLAPVGTDGTAVFTTGTNGMRLSADRRTLYLDRDDLTNIGGVDVTAGKSIYRISFGVVVDGLEAEVGDCVIDVSGKSTVIPGSLTIGSFADYGYTIKVADEDKEIIAGRNNNEDSVASKVTIKENVGGSLLNGRTIIMELPDGVEWLPNQGPAANIIVDTKSLSNGMDFAAAQTVTNKPNIAKAVLAQAGVVNKGEMSFEPQVAVAADYEGPITIEFSGTAGINETITIGKVVKGLTATADPIDVKIGSQDQKGADIVVKEVKAGTLLATGGTALTITAPQGVGFSKLPTVKAEGDITIGTVTRVIGADGTRDNVVNIPIRSASSKTAATITISDVYYSLDRTVPEGNMKLTVGGTAINEAGINNRGTAVSVLAANCVTPAPDEGTIGAASGQFRIDSNIYVVNGVSKVMDVAPYIKSGRTYVPVRYLGYALGVAEADVVWDEASQKVTLTKGDNVVELTIGSTTITVNGEAQTMDVAPEITNGRTMLPARYVAEGLGYVVGWDPATRTVLISK